ncbi:hypothetical protein ONA91_19680 [Micromonospora sp. DR5-3]|uniref:hypothetical protein n=1 Tax=Micromonospora sp. DR5-3 TaxID=2992129 RepID=UPI00223247E4|nr:hypothetical protein [Micromonospora sp. DR5-3]MCW3816670.1 hypothetical protein [Micromonospora sp. DR5-3]
MHRGRTLALLAVLAAAATTAGCAGRGGGEPEPPTGGEALVLRLSELPGMLAPGGAAAVPPSFSLFGDGRLISVAAGPSGGWPQLREDRVPPDGVRDLFRDAAALPDHAAVDGPDAPVVRVVVGATGGPRTVTLPRSDPAAARLRAALAGYAAGSLVPYRPAAVAIVATPADPTEPARPWPLPTLAGEPLTGTGAGASCLVLRGADLETVRRETATAGAETRWRSAGRVWQVAPRPLLPDETGCADL